MSIPKLADVSDSLHSELRLAESISEAQMPVYDANELIFQGSVAQITLNTQAYFLRITRAGKLILTK